MKIETKLTTGLVPVELEDLQSGDILYIRYRAKAGKNDWDFTAFLFLGFVYEPSVKVLKGAYSTHETAPIIVFNTEHHHYKLFKIIEPYCENSK